jgi:hypothetical protein
MTAVPRDHWPRWSRCARRAPAAPGGRSRHFARTRLPSRVDQAQAAQQRLGRVIGSGRLAAKQLETVDVQAPPPEPVAAEVALPPAPAEWGSGWRRAPATQRQRPRLRRPAAGQQWRRSVVWGGVEQGRQEQRRSKSSFVSRQVFPTGRQGIRREPSGQSLDVSFWQQLAPRIHGAQGASIPAAALCRPPENPYEQST